MKKNDEIKPEGAGSFVSRAPEVNKGEFPDPFLVPGKGRISCGDEWEQAAEYWRRLIVDTEYGGFPPPPEELEIETLSRSRVSRWTDMPRLWTFRINCAGGETPFSFCVKILFPADDASGPFPAIVNGDGCWMYISDGTARRVLDAGCALVTFNRTEAAEDLGYQGVIDRRRRSGGLYDVYPGMSFGALSAWAWCYHRCVDMLQTLSFIDSGKIAVSGHSRGGKTVLLAGATDTRVALVNDNASGAGGSGPFRYVGGGGETLDIINEFPSWFGPGLQPYLGREEELPFDQHCFLACIAPRRLLITYASGDRWSNPEGMVRCAAAAGEVYRFLGAGDRIAFHLREGEHLHSEEDWEALLDFIKQNWMGAAPARDYNRHPYGRIEPAFSWRAPSACR